ncbi:MAG: hypothetical protein Q4P06_05235 [Actinomycetaceae bacterium]|nr:hypothetical protein [Actinomycetaceae bacterium]
MTTGAKVLAAVLAVGVTTALGAIGVFGGRAISPPSQPGVEPAVTSPVATESQLPTPSETPTPQPPKTKTHCTTHNRLCFDYPGEGRVEESFTSIKDGEKQSPNDGPFTIEGGQVYDGEGTELVRYFDNWLGQRLCLGSYKVVNAWPIDLTDSQGNRAAVVSAVVQTKHEYGYLAQLLVTTDPDLMNAGSEPTGEKDCVGVFDLAAGSDEKQQRIVFKVAEEVKASSEEEALAALESERYRDALEVLRTQHRE